MLCSLLLAIPLTSRPGRMRRARLPPSSAAPCDVAFATSRPRGALPTGRSTIGVPHALAALGRAQCSRARASVAGSARSGSNASSAAPSSGASAPSARRHDPDQGPRRRAAPGGRARRSSASPRRTGGSARRGRRGRRAAGSRMLTRPASPMPSQRPTSVERRQGRRRARARPRPARRRPPAGRRPRGGRRGAAGPPRRRRVSQQPTEPQRHGSPSGSNGDVADLAAVAGDAGQRPARRRSGRRRRRPRPRGRGRRRRPTAAPRRCSARAPRSASLATVIGHVASGAPPRAARRAGRRASRGSAPSRRARRPAGRRRRPRRRCPTIGAGAGRTARGPGDELGRGRPRSSSTDEWPRGRSTRSSSKTVAAEPDEGGGERVDGDLERQDDAARRARSGRAATAGPGSPRCAAPSSTTRPAAASSPIEAADRAARQAGPGDELGARQRARGVERADDRAQVRAADRLAALPDLVAAGSHGFVFLSSKSRQGSYT